MFPLSDPTSLASPLAIRAIVAALQSGPLTAAELARRGGLSEPSALGALESLERAGCARRTEQSGPSPVYEIAGNRVVVLGADLGGTKVHLALSDLAGTILAEEMEPTDPRGGRHVVAQIGMIAERLRRQTGAIAAPRIAAIGSAGVLDHRSGRVDISPNIPGLDTINVREALELRLGCPVILENDVNLAALGEQWHGSCEGNQNFVFIALGTGIGMGLIADGRLVRGARGAAGEIAYLPIGSDPFDSAGYRLGPLETAIGSVGILRFYRDRGGKAADFVRGIFERLSLGETAAIETVDHTAHMLVRAVMAVRAIVDPTLVVLGGSIGVRRELVERVRDLMAPLPIDLAVRESSLGSRAVLVGATSLALAQVCERLLGAATTET